MSFADEMRKKAYQKNIQVIEEEKKEELKSFRKIQYLLFGKHATERIKDASAVCDISKRIIRCTPHPGRLEVYNDHCISFTKYFGNFNGVNIFYEKDDSCIESNGYITADWRSPTSLGRSIPNRPIKKIPKKNNRLFRSWISIDYI